VKIAQTVLPAYFKAYDLAAGVHPSIRPSSPNNAYRGTGNLFEGPLDLSLDSPPLWLDLEPIETGAIVLDLGPQPVVLTQHRAIG
jgi:hypothetical protein